MPIDSNIALGVRPIEQPNMLGQMGQFMALRAAQQETEGYEGVKNALTGGMDASDPRLLQYGKRGIEAFKAAGEGKIKQLEAGKKQSEMLGNIFGGVMQDPSSGPAAVSQLLKMGVIKPEEAQQVMTQAGNDPEAWKKIAAPYYQQSIDSTKRFQDETERWKANLQATVTREGHGVQMRGQNMTAGTAEKALDFQKQKRNVIAGEGQFLNTDAYGNVYPVAQYGAVNGPNAPASPLPPAAAGNFLATQVAPQQPATNVNALNAPPGAPTVDNAAAMQNVPRPKEPIRQPVGVMKDGKAVFVKPEEAVGMQPASADAEKAARLQTQKVKDLSLTIKNLEDVTKPGGLISQSTGSGIGRAYDVGAGLFGQATEGAIATAKLAPIADMVLKMVPRFEGPQSDKDTQSYKEAAGQLANSSLPTKTRQEAGKEILRLMKEYKGQFVTDDMAKEGFGGAALTGEDKAAMDWANANPKDPRAAQIKQRLGG